jgi:hypothetical protein
MPMASLSDDVRALYHLLNRTEGPLVPAAQGYAGAFTASTKDEGVCGSVFVAVLAPDEGEAVADMVYRGQQHPQGPELAPDSYGFISKLKTGFAAAFVEHAPPDRQARLLDGTSDYGGACPEDRRSICIWPGLGDRRGDPVVAKPTVRLGSYRAKLRIGATRAVAFAGGCLTAGDVN